MSDSKVSTDWGPGGLKSGPCLLGYSEHPSSGLNLVMITPIYRVTMYFSLIHQPSRLLVYVNGCVCVGMGRMTSIS